MTLFPVAIRVLCALLVIVPALPAAGQTPGSIRGVVRNEANGEALPDVLIRVNETGHETRTGVNGGFEFARIRAGRYTLAPFLFRGLITNRAGL
jgi:hypothetical protein